MMLKLETKFFSQFQQTNGLLFQFFLILLIQLIQLSMLFNFKIIVVQIQEVLQDYISKILKLKVALVMLQLTHLFQLMHLLQLKHLYQQLNHHQFVFLKLFMETENLKMILMEIGVGEHLI